MAINLFKRAKTIWNKAGKKNMSWKAAVKKAAAELRKSPRQTGTSDKKRDAARKSKKPGRRRSAAGRIYYERRKDRTDKPGSVTGKANYLTFPLIYWRTVKNDKIPFVEKGGSFFTDSGQKIHWQFLESRVAQSWLKKHKMKSRLK